MGRLTEYTGHGYVAYDPIDTKYDFSEINLQKLIDKLAHYEDLEEAGRLVVLPEGFDLASLVRALDEDVCPGKFGLNEENCRTATCEQCWAAALKGGGVDV